MRRVACYAAESAFTDGESLDDAFESAAAVVDAWLREKGASGLVAGDSTFPMRKSGSGRLSGRHYVAQNCAEWDLSLEQPTETGRFLTRVVLGRKSDSLHLFVELRAGHAGQNLAPADVDVYCPKVLRDLLVLRSWTVGKTVVSAQRIRWAGAEAASRFANVLMHPDRNLPIVAVSELSGFPLTPDLAEDIGKDLCGLAVVAQLDDAASWQLTRALGKEWSCFDGAIRVYWPVRGRFQRSFEHPYWTRQGLIDSTGSTLAAASAIRSELRRRLLELSTYAVDEAPELVQIRDEAQRESSEREIQAARDRGDQDAEIEGLMNRCVSLEGRLEQLKDRNQFLEDQVRSFSQAHFYQTSPSSALAPEAEAAVEDVEQAVEQARVRFSDDLLFGDDVIDGARSVAPDAGPPDKIYEHLKTLAELARRLREGSLGRKLMDWLAQQGISASNESDQIEGNKVEVQRRTWNAGEGRRFFSSHLKPNEHTGPDKCVRIYFEYDVDLRKVIVGWVGRHP